MASNRCLCTIGYCSSTMPVARCLWPMRASSSSGAGASGSTRVAAKVATDAASAFCCAPCFWLPRLNVLASSSGWAVNMRR